MYVTRATNVKPALHLFSQGVSSPQSLTSNILRNEAAKYLKTHSGSSVYNGGGLHNAYSAESECVLLLLVSNII